MHVHVDGRGGGGVECMYYISSLLLLLLLFPCLPLAHGSTVRGMNVFFCFVTPSDVL